MLRTFCPARAMISALKVFGNYDRERKCLLRLLQSEVFPKPARRTTSFIDDDFGSRPIGDFSLGISHSRACR
eukprot:1560363-Amphidinium_carterae.1